MLFQSLLKISWDSVHPTRSTLFTYCPVYLVIVICNQRKLISHKANSVDCQCQDITQTITYNRLWYNLNLKSKIANCNFYPCPSDTVKHSPEISKPGSSLLTLNKLIVQLSKFVCWNYKPALSWLCGHFYFTQKYRSTLSLIL